MKSNLWPVATVACVLVIVGGATIRIIAAIDSEIGVTAWLAIGAIGAGLLLFVAVGGAVALVLRWIRGSRHIHARDGVFPLFPASTTITNPNEPGAQTLAAMAAGARISAPMAGRVIDAHYRSSLPDAPAGRPERAIRFPERVEVYDAPLPPQLALTVGQDGHGRPVALPLRNLGNVLVAGLPGGGKSEMLASMMAGLLRQDASGRRVQLAAIDTKLVSFGPMPADIAAMFACPATTVESAHALMSQMADEVGRRFRLLHDARVRSLQELSETAAGDLPYLVAFIDELADLTQDANRQRAKAFLHVAQEIGRKGRASGVSLVMATQRPSSDVIPSSLRNLAGAAVAFRVAKAGDSRIVLDAPGAEALPTIPGRCLVRQAGVIEAQGYLAGLEGGRFDAFCQSLPAAGGETLNLPQPLDRVPVYNPPPPQAGTVVLSGPGVGQPLAAGREPDAQLAAAMRGLYDAGTSKTAICTRTWGYKDGDVWAILERVLENRL